jgi:hypothetical protein
MIDLNDAEPQREGGLIPEGTIALAVMSIRPGGFGEDGFVARSKSSGNDMLDVEFTVLEGKYERRKVWKYMSLAGDGAPVTRSQLRAALESAFKILPSDDSPAAQEGRRATTYGAFDGLSVCIKIGIEKGKDGYADKNTLRGFVTPDRPDYIFPGAQQPKSAAAPRAGVAATVAAAARPTNGAAKPAWAS